MATISQLNGNTIKDPTALNTAGSGLKKNGSTVSVDPSKVPVVERDSWYGGLVPYCTGVANSAPTWGAIFASNDAVAYSLAQRDGNGNVAGSQRPLYRHTGALYVGGSIFYFSILCSKPTALNVNDFYERSDFVYTLRDVPDGGHTLTYMYYDTEDDYYYAYFLLDSYYYASTAYVAWDSVSQL